MARSSRKTRTFPKPTVNHWVLPLPGAGISVFETEIPALLGRLLGLMGKILFDGCPGSQDAAVDGLVGDPLHGGNIPAAHAMGDMHQEPAALFFANTLKRNLQQATLALQVGLCRLFLLTGKVGILGGIGVHIRQRFFVQQDIFVGLPPAVTPFLGKQARTEVFPLLVVLLGGIRVFRQEHLQGDFQHTIRKAVQDTAAVPPALMARILVVFHGA